MAPAPAPSQQFSARHLAALTAAAWTVPRGQIPGGLRVAGRCADPGASALAPPEPAHVRTRSPAARRAGDRRPSRGSFRSRRGASERGDPAPADAASAREALAATTLADPASVDIRPGPEGPTPATNGPIATMIEVATDPADLADRIARLLDDEADLRGLDR